MNCGIFGWEKGGLFEGELSLKMGGHDPTSVQQNNLIQIFALYLTTKAIEDDSLLFLVIFFCNLFASDSTEIEKKKAKKMILK